MYGCALRNIRPIFQHLETLSVTANLAISCQRSWGFGDLLGDGQRFVERDRPLLDAIRQGRPFNEFEDQGPYAVSFFEAVDLRDVGVVQGGEDLGLSLEPGEAIRVSGKRVGEDLQRHLAVELRVSRLIDLPHPAFADEGGDVVMAEAGTDG